MIIEIGNRIKISIILKFNINKKGVPKTNTPTPIIDCKAIMIQKYAITKLLSSIKKWLNLNYYI